MSTFGLQRADHAVHYSALVDGAWNVSWTVGGRIKPLLTHWYEHHETRAHIISCTISRCASYEVRKSICSTLSFDVRDIHAPLAIRTVAEIWLQYHATQRHSCARVQSYQKCWIWRCLDDGCLAAWWAQLFFKTAKEWCTCIVAPFISVSDHVDWHDKF